MNYTQPSWEEYRILKHMRGNGYFRYGDVYRAAIAEMPMPNFNEVLNRLHDKCWVQVIMCKCGIYIQPNMGMLTSFWQRVLWGGYGNQNARHGFRDLSTYGIGSNGQKKK